MIIADYLDNADTNTPAAEQAYRQRFAKEARRIVRAWAHRPWHMARTAKPVTLGELLARQRCDPFKEAEAAGQVRIRLRERFRVYEAGDAGPKTRLLGYRPGHTEMAARARGRHHAMVNVLEPWYYRDTADVDIFDLSLLRTWLQAVERWASKPIESGIFAPAPRLLDFVPDEPEEHMSLPPAPSPPAAPPRLKLTRVDQIEIRPPQWLLRGMLERDTLALMFGDPGCGKSFLAIDWAARVATGTPWRGHPVKGGSVVYVAGEGRQGFARRTQAWSEHHGVSLAGAPFYLLPAVAIPDPVDLRDLMATIDVGVATVGHPALIVLDTLARCFGGGDENSTQDMTRFVAACDAIRRRYGCTILVVHHAGHGDKTRARGAIALKAALDAEYRLENETGLMLTATKMKDAETPPPLNMELVSVTLPGVVDDYGNPVTSAAVEVTDADTSAIVAKAKVVSGELRGKWQKLGLKIARRLIAESDDSQASVAAWHEACDAAGMRQSTRYSVLANLHDQGVISVNGEMMSTS